MFEVMGFTGRTPKRPFYTTSSEVEASQAALVEKAREIQLAQCLVYYDGHRIGKVERPRLLYHRYADAAVIICPQQALRQAAGFLAEHYIIAVAELCLGVAAGRLGAGVMYPRPRVAGHEIPEVIILGYIDQIPVIQPGALEMLVGYLEAKGLYKMQPCAGGGAGAGGIAGVEVYLRLV